jgi:hypothetical protein
MRKVLIALAVTAAAFVVEVPAPAGAAIGPVPARVDAWAFCGVRPSDPTAAAAVASIAASGVSATFGPCNDPAPGDYTVIDPRTRYVDPATYMQLVLLNASVGMKTLVYDARIYSTEADKRDAAVAFWQPVLQHIQAWDVGDEYQPPPSGDWTFLRQRWNTVRNLVTPATGVPPYANHVVEALDDALTDLAGSDQLLSFTRYTGDLGASVARQYDARTRVLMCGINTYDHFGLVPTPTKIREGMYDLVEAGCDRFLVFGGQRVYDSVRFGDKSLVDTTGAPTDWNTAVLEGSGRSSFVALPPARLLETRPGLPTADGRFAGVGPRLGGTVTELDVAGRAGVRRKAVAVALNVTVTNATAPGFVTAYPCDAPRPLAAQVNFPARTDVATAVVVKLAADGRLCLFSPVDTDLLVDLNGYYPPGTSYEPLQPARLLETRADPGLATVDGQFLALGPRTAGQVTELQVRGRGGVPTDAGEAVLNVTVTAPSLPGFVTVYPCDGPRPTASNLNYPANATVTNAVVAPIDATGRVCLFTLVPAELVVDVNGYVPERASFVSVAPARLMDTRPDEGIVTIDGQQARLGLRPAGSTTALIVAGRASISSTARAVVLTVTVTGPTAAGFLTLHACGDPRPLASNLNFTAGTTVANLVTAEIGDNASVCVFTSVPAHLVIDVTNYHP